MQRIYYIGQGNLYWTKGAEQSLEHYKSIVVIFERYNYKQRTLLHGAFRGRQIQTVTGALPKEYREHAIGLWGQDWYQKLVKGGMISYVQILEEHVRTSVDVVPRSQPDKVTQGTTPIRFSNLELKRCNICGQELPKYVYFQKYYKTFKDPRQSYCKVCQKYYLRWWRRGNQAGTGQTFKQYCESDPDWKFETQFRL